MLALEELQVVVSAGVGRTQGSVRFTVVRVCCCLEVLAGLSAALGWIWRGCVLPLRMKGVCLDLNAKLRHGVQRRYKMVKECFEVGDWETRYTVKAKNGESMAVRMVAGSMILVQVDWHYVCGQQKEDE